MIPTIPQRIKTGLVFCTFLFLLTAFPIVMADTFDITAGDTAALIAALDAANVDPATPVVINLESGIYTLTAVNNIYIERDPWNGIAGSGEQGLPVIQGQVTINGNGSIIERDASAPDFRFFLNTHTGDLTLNNLTLRGGRATLTGSPFYWNGNEGGAILNFGIVTLNDSLITLNYASLAGGGIASLTGKLVLNRTSMSENQSDMEGGGILSYTELIIADSTIASNTTGTTSGVARGGGLALQTNSNIRMTNTTISDNRALGDASLNGDGGGIYALGSYTVTIEISSNSTISGNFAGRGGGIYMTTGSPLILRNITISNNIASDEGGGIFTQFDRISRFENTLIADNQPTNCNPGYIFLSLGNNLDSDGSCNLDEVTDLSDEDPLLGPLTDNGGPTFTHALMPGSPAIDRANQSICPSTDQRGQLRDGSCDIGAYEFLPPSINQYDTHNPVLTWNRVSLAAAYELEIATSRSFTTPTAFRYSQLPAEPLYLIVPDTISRGTWYWHVRARYADGTWSRWSLTETLSVTVP